jgi:restriction endonuclease S subunit
MKINNGHVLSGYIEIPSLKEQNKISLFLNKIDKKIEHVGNQLAKMEQWKRAYYKRCLCKVLVLGMVRGIESYRCLICGFSKF